MQATFLLITFHSYLLPSYVFEPHCVSYLPWMTALLYLSSQAQYLHYSKHCHTQLVCTTSFCWRHKRIPSWNVIFSLLPQCSVVVHEEEFLPCRHSYRYYGPVLFSLETFPIFFFSSEFNTFQTSTFQTNFQYPTMLLWGTLRFSFQCSHSRGRQTH